jgi:hypothetical protein
LVLANWYNNKQQTKQKQHNGACAQTQKMTLLRIIALSSVCVAWGRSPWPQTAYAAANAKLATMSSQDKFSMLYGRLLGGYIGNGTLR